MLNPNLDEIQLTKKNERYSRHPTPEVGLEGKAS